MFQFPASRPGALWIRATVHESCSCGFPHSDITGSLPAYGSPMHFGVRSVLLRLCVPRLPPYALSSLTYVQSLYFL